MMHQEAMVRDAVLQKDLGVYRGSFTALLQQDESRLLIITPGAAAAGSGSGSGSGSGAV
jgi:hypothetical protein